MADHEAITDVPDAAGWVPGIRFDHPEQIGRSVSAKFAPNFRHRRRLLHRKQSLARSEN
jgi:hypothetical protein